MIQCRKASLSDQGALSRFLEPFRAERHKSASFLQLTELLSNERQFMLILAEDAGGSVIGLQALLPAAKPNCREVFTFIDRSQPLPVGSRLFD